jgi:integrase
MARLGWESNPAVLAGRPKVRNRNPRPVPMELWLAVWTHELPDDARVALGLGYFCGLRREELVRLTRGQVWGGALVNFTRKHGGEDRMDVDDLLDHWQRTLPQSEPHRLVAPLSRLSRREGDGLLLPWASTRPEALNKRMCRWLCQCDVPSGAFTPHQLRHSFATNLVATGVPLALVASLCNHGSMDITMRYVRVGTGQLAALRAPIVEEAR